MPRNTTLLWIACAGLALFCAGVAALAPETQYDALWYHLTYPQRYLQAGYLVDIPADFVSLYPMTTELWYGYGLALGGATAAILLHLGYLPLAAVLTYEFARRYTPGATPWLAVALLVTMPTVIWLGSTANTDLAIMLFVALALYALLRYVDTSRRQWLLLAALNLGFALSTKHLALFALALFCPGLLLVLRSRGAGWRHAFLAALALGVLSLLVALPWYLRSYLATGNPVFETMYTIFGAPPARWNALTQAGQQDFLHQFGRPRTLANLLTLPWHMTIHAAGYGGTLGPLFLILLPMLILRRLRGVWPWLAALVVLWLAAVVFTGDKLRSTPVDADCTHSRRTCSIRLCPRRRSCPAGGRTRSAGVACGRPGRADGGQPAALHALARGRPGQLGRLALVRALPPALECSLGGQSVRLSHVRARLAPTHLAQPRTSWGEPRTNLWQCGQRPSRLPLAWRATPAVLRANEIRRMISENAPSCACTMPSTSAWYADSLTTASSKSTTGLLSADCSTSRSTAARVEDLQQALDYLPGSYWA